MADVISLGAARSARLEDPRSVALSDDDLVAEYTAQKLIRKAIQDFKQAILDTNALSCLTRINPNAFDDFVHDEITTENVWDEKIAEARRT